MKRNRNRLGELGSFYHVFSRGIDRKQLFVDDRDRHTFLLILGDVLRETSARCYAFALMGNHYHLLLQTVGTPLSDVMHRVNVRYALHFNRRHGGVGHVFQGRFQSVLVESEEHMETVLAYVHLNPVRAGLIEDERALRDYRWTGHATLMGRAHAPFLESNRVLAWFGDDLKSARRDLAAFMCGILVPGSDAVDEPSALLDFVCESLRFSRQSAQNLQARNVRGVIGDHQRIDEIQRRRDRSAWCRRRLERESWTPERLLNRICGVLGVAPSCVRSGSRRRDHSRARALFCHLASQFLGVSMQGASRHVGISAAAASRASRLGATLARTQGLTPEVIFESPWLRTDRDDPSAG